MGRLLGRLFVTSTTALILFISYTPQFFIIWPWYGRELSIELLALLVPFKYDPTIPFAPCCDAHEPFESILVGILLYNYYLCVTTDPGVVPHNWVRRALTLNGHSLLMRAHSGTRIRRRGWLRGQEAVWCPKALSHMQDIQTTARTSLQDLQ